MVDYDICAVQQRLSDKEGSLYFLSTASRDSGCKHFLSKRRSDMTSFGIVRCIRHQYMSELKQSNTLSHVLKLHMLNHTREHDIISEK